MNHFRLSRITRAIAATLAGSMFMLQPAKASLPDMNIFNDADEISDAELSDMRGRYVGTSEILYFGVEMYTQWQTQDGRTLNAGLNMAVDSQLRPTVTIVTQNTSPQGGVPAPQAAAGQNSISISNGISNVSGVGQSIQIGGDGNSIKNDLNMNIDLHASSSPIKSGATNGITLNGAGPTVIDNNNMTTTVTLGGNDLSMAINVPGQGQVMQQLKSGSGFLQSAQISGDLNRIHNTINVNAGLRAAAGMPTGGLQNSLDSLRGLRPAGSY